MNPFVFLPGIVEISQDPLGPPVVFVMVVVLAWFVVSLLEHGNQATREPTCTDHDRSSGWW